MTKIRWICALVAVAGVMAGCEKPSPVPEEYRGLDEETRAQRKYVNLFAWNAMNTYYLWRDEVSAALEKWGDWDEPIQKVADVRYKDAQGHDIDRWTMLTDDFSSFSGGVSGHTRTNGMDFVLYYADQAKTRICAVVTYTYAGSPAEKAGLKRGDVILTLDGQEMTPDNYQELVRDRLLGGGTVKAGLRGGGTVTLTAVDMYEDPVQTACVLENALGRKVGYLHYTSFTLDSCDDLVEAFRGFTQAGIDDLVLDLRYNGGGYIITEEVLASLVAPVREVEAKSILSREIYNATLTKEIGADTTFFRTDFSFRDGGETHVVSTQGANPDLPRLYVLATGSSASASESLVCCLKPYMDVILLGNRTSGKYCAGVMLEASSWYAGVKDNLEEGEYEKAKPYVDNWGLYVMYARYADRDGVTLSMPDGIAPDYEVNDNPLDGYPLGDPRETMLAAALELMEGGTRAIQGENGPIPCLEPVPGDSHPRGTQLLIRLL